MMMHSLVFVLGAFGYLSFLLLRLFLNYTVCLFSCFKHRSYPKLLSTDFYRELSALDLYKEYRKTKHEQRLYRPATTDKHVQTY